MFVGLDFETSGLRPELGHVPYTLGLAWEETVYDGDESETAIHTHEFEFNYRGDWDIEATRVNGIWPAVLPFVSRNDTSYDVDVCKFLKETFGYEQLGALQAVGWNVGVFDMKFLAYFFPNATKFFSHRPLELNTLAYACDTVGATMEAKKEVKEFLEENHQCEWHNAEWDAKAALLSKNWMDTQLLEMGL